MAEITESRTRSMLYLNERYLKLDWDEANRILLAEWRGFSNSTDFRAGLATGLEIVAKHRVANWLADIREAKVISIDDQNYHGQVWIPQAIKLGLKRMAFVVPRDVLAQMALNRVASQLQGLETRYFSDVEAARQWLKSFPLAQD